VYFHGGGWISADKNIYKGIAATFSHKGFLTFNVNYRLAPKNRFPAPLRDAVCALEWINRNAARYGGDVSGVVLAGDSAGAQIASWYASVTPKDSLYDQVGINSVTSKVTVKGLVLFYGVYDFDTVLQAHFPFIKTYARSFLGTDSQAYAQNSELASPIRQVSRNLPPVWLCAGENDGLFTQSKAYADALEKHGVCCRTLFFSRSHRANHGFLFFRWLTSSKNAVGAAVEFLREYAKVGC
jgi:acetyl esterase/lipase